MKTLINIDAWERKDHFNFFTQFTEPFFGVTVTVDCTIAYQQAKQQQRSFFLYYLYRTLKAANSIENFRYRIIDKQVYLYDTVHASPTIDRPNRPFGFAYVDYDADETIFYANALQEIERVKATTGLEPSRSGDNVLHCSAMPWLNFTSVSHARNFNFPDSCPKVSYGKLIDTNGIKTMPVSIHAHHGLMDGYHVGLFVERFQELLNEKC